MPQSFRQPEILSVARRQGRVTVEGLAARFGVSVQTVRRDLTEMAEAGKLDRVHGGAVLPSGVRNIGYQDRRNLNAQAKAAIAKTCAGLIANGTSLFLNIGTTTEAVARELLQHSALLVVTNNLNVANILAANPECEIIVTGGTLRRSDGALVGHLTMRTIEQFKLDTAIIGCSALDASGDILDFDVAEVCVSQGMIARVRQTILVADHSKFQRTAPARIASLQAMATFVTDQPPARNVQQYCADWGTEIRLAD